MEQIHLIIIGTIAIFIIYKQWTIYKDTIDDIYFLEQSFPENLDNTYIKNDQGIVTYHENPIFKTIIESLNGYIGKNKNSITDFHIIKDIVDRNADSAEEEISTQVPIPLYYGLMGTMAGIFIGIGYLVFTGGLNSLIDNTAGNNADIGAKGINGLLGGVALAMFSSIVGIYLTTKGSIKLKNCKVNLEKNKNIFLSWIQAELLPKLSTDMTSALMRMTQNLTEFNSTFSQNTQELRETLSLVSDSFEEQVELLEAVRNLRITNIATANIAVYEKLKNCTNEIGQFAQYLQNVNGYISTVNALNEKLDMHETRTKAIEDMGAFFMTERANMTAWNGIAARSIGEVDSTMQELVENFKVSASDQFQGLSQHTIVQKETFERIADEQQQALLSRTAEIDIIVEELKGLNAVKESLDVFTETSKEHNQKIDELIKTIKKTSQSKTTELPSIQQTENASVVHFNIPKWVKISGVAAISILVIPQIISLVFYIISFF